MSTREYRGVNLEEPEEREARIRYDRLQKRMVRVVVSLAIMAMGGLGYLFLSLREKAIDVALGNVKVEQRARQSWPQSFDVCDTLDATKDPKHVELILAHVSEETKVPESILYGVWIHETHGEVGGDKGRSGGCNVLHQLKIRCKRGGNCAHLKALYTLAKRFVWDLNTFQGSCGTSTMEEPTGNYGGCVGPMQISLGEWVKDDDGYYADKDPLNLCWAMMHTGDSLRAYYLSKFKEMERRYRDLNQVVDPWVRDRDRDLLRKEAWNYAIRRYRGGAESPASYEYQMVVNRIRLNYELNHHLAQNHARRAIIRYGKLYAVNEAR